MKFQRARLLLLSSALLTWPAMALAVPSPTPRVSPLTAQTKAVHDAQAALDLAKKQVLVIRKHVETTFVSKPEWKAAKATLDKAKNDYDTEARKVLSNLEKNADYQALQAKRDKAQAVMDQSHAPAAASPSGDDPVKLTDDQITAAVKEHGDAVLQMKDMQKQAQDSDTTLAALAQKKADAQTAWDAMQVQVDDMVKTDPAYPQAEQAVDAATLQLQQAKDQLAAASKSQRESDEAAIRSKSGR